MTLFETEYRADLIANRSKKRQPKVLRTGLESNAITILILTFEEFVEAATDAKGGIASDTINSANQMIKIASDFGLKSGSYRIDETKKLIILKGFAGLRKFLTSPKYGTTHWKVMDLGLGIKGAKNLASRFLRANIFFSVADSVISSVMQDEASFSFFFSSLSTTIVKSYLAGAASGAVLTALSTTGVAAGFFAVGVAPVACALLVGVGIAIVLQYVDNKFGLTDKLANKLSEEMSKLEAYYDNILRKTAKEYNKIEKGFMCSMDYRFCGYF